MLTGDIVRNDIIQAGYGKNSDMRHRLSVYTIDLNNPIGADLIAWFQQYEPYYVDPLKFPTPIPPLP